MERRNQPRYEVWLPVKIDALKEGIAVTHDASARGVLMATASTLEPGAVVEFELRIPDKEPQRLTGRVVRVEENSDDPHGLWPHRMAVEFEQEQSELEWLLGAVQRLR